MLPQWHACRLPAAICAATLAFLLTGCSFSYQLDNLFGKRDEADGTGSLRLAPKPRAIEEAPAGGDLEIARAAVRRCLSCAPRQVGNSPPAAVEEFVADCSFVARVSRGPNRAMSR